MRYFDMMVRGGVMMWPIAVSLLIALWLVVDRFMAFRRADADAPKVLAHLRNLFRRGDSNSVLAFCDENRSVLARLIRQAVVHRENGGARMHEALAGVRHEEVRTLEHRLPLLGLTAVIAPLLGFLGTLMGMIAVLRGVEVHPATAGSALMAGRMWGALLPSAFGLAVGIPVYAFFVYFTARARQFTQSLESTVPKVIEMVAAPGPAEEHRIQHSEPKAVRGPVKYDEDEFFKRKTEAKAR